MKTTLFAGASVGLILLASATTAAAQSIDYGAMEQLFNEPVTTSATGSPQRSTEVSADMQIISAADIKRSGASDLPTILGRVAGLDVLSWSAGASDVGVRGYNQALSPRLLVLINGRQVYLDHYGYTAWSTLPVRLEEIRQIEVVKGPNSALFGFNAVSGVINIITFNPKFDDVSSATVQVGSGDHREVSLVHTVKLGDRLSARLSAGGASRQEWKNTVGVASNLLHDPARVSANLDVVAQITDKTELRVESSWSNAQEGAMTTNYQYTPIKYIVTSTKATLSSDTKAGLLQLTAYRNNLDEKIAILNVPGKLKNTITVVNGQNLFKIGADHAFRVSLEYRENEVNTAPIEGAMISYKVLSPSAMWHWAVTEKLALTTAVRFDKLDLKREGPYPTVFPTRTNADWDRSIKETSYNLGVVYHASPLDTLRVSVARGVQVPTLVDLGGLQLAAGGRPPFGLGVAGNPALKPAIVTDYQLAYTRTVPALDATVSATLFAQKTQDVKGNPASGQPDVAGTATTYPFLTFRNIGDSEMTGVEFKASGKIAGGYHWSGDATWTKIDDQPDAGFNPTVRYSAFDLTSPEFRGNVAFGWENTKWSADAYLRYVGDFQMYRSATLIPVKAYATLSGRVARNFENGLTIAVSGQNLLKDRQLQTSSLLAERQLLLSVSKSF